MTFGQQLVMMLTLMLTSKGVAGVPRAALVVLTATLTQFGLPLEGAAILLGIDQIMDMGRTAVNVMGNCIATAVVARWEGVFDDERMRAFARTASNPGPPDADCGGRRARAARRRGRPRMSRRHTRSSAFDARRARRQRRRGGGRGDGARAARRHRQRRGVQRRRRRRRSSGRGAERQRLRRPRAGAGGAAHGATLVHYSTDFVFDGTARRRRTRKTDRPNPQSVYAASKLLGEWFARDAPRAYVLRVESLFGTAPGAGPAKGSVAGILQRAEGRRRREGVRRPDDLADLRARTRRARRGSCSRSRRRPGCITA